MTSITNRQMQAPHQTCSEIIQSIQALVPVGAPVPESEPLLDQLRSLTQALIKEYEASGRLQDDPFKDVWHRPLTLYKNEVCQKLHGKTVLVTGGEGFVGSFLINKLLGLGVKRIISVDNVRCQNDPAAQPIPGTAENVCLYPLDVRNYEGLKQIFAAEKPEIVFHLAAIRIPGEAEKIVLETVTTNIFGTQNIIRLCEEYQVEQCIFSSTGKASRYWTAEVYAATKKVNEWLFAHAVQTGTVQYGMVRFTHMLNNSSMYEQISDKVERGCLINIHAPERYVVGQNVGEAAHLLLNALVFSERDRLKFILVRNLGWPTESLEVALYKIKESGKNLPIYFQGTPLGYGESFFLGQVDWNHQTEINTLINALETENCSAISSTGEMIVSEIIPFSSETLFAELAELKAMISDPAASDKDVKWRLAELVNQVSLTTFRQASVKRSLEILRWGLNLRLYERGEYNLTPYQPFIELVVQSLSDRVDRAALDACKMSLDEFGRAIAAIKTFPTLAEAAAQLENTLCRLQEEVEQSLGKAA